MSEIGICYLVNILANRRTFYYIYCHPVPLFFMFFVLYIPKMGKAVKSMPEICWGGILKGRKAVGGMPEICWGGILKGCKAVTGMPETCWGGIPKGRKAVKSMPKMVYAIDSSVAFENRL